MTTGPRRNLREQIARRVVVVLGPSIAVTAVAAIIAILIVQPDQPARMYGAFVALALLVPTAWFAARKRWKLAAASVLSTIGVAALVSMWNGGGPLAPGYWLTLPMVAITGWLYGTRPAVLTAIGAVIVGLAFGWLQVNGHLSPGPPRTLLLIQVSIAIFASLMIVAAVVPASMAGRAFEESEDARLALLDAQAREQKARMAFDAVFDQVFELVGLLDPSGRVLRANATALNLIGATQSQIVGQYFWDTPWWSEEDKNTLRSAIEKGARGERSRFKTHHVDRAGKRRVIDFSLTPYTSDGQIVYLIPEGRDITDLVEAQDRLTHSRKMDAIGQLAGGIAHDFNNLLTGIMGAADMLAWKHQNQDNESKEMIALILEASHRAADLTTQLLTFSRKNAPHRRNLDINGCIKSVAALLQRTIDPSIKLVLDLEPQDPCILGDASLIENAILNLAINARDAMESGGTLTLQSQSMELNRAAAVATGFNIQPGPCVRITVQDTGYGIPEEYRARIFEPFFTTKETGTGLGLPSVFGTVDSHGGAILVYSEPGEGTQFQMYFPASTAPAAVRPSLPETHSPAEGLRVLLAEDDAISRTVTELQLTSLGCKVRVENDGHTALETFRRTPDDFDLVVLDVIMPGMRGPMAARRMLETRPDLAVLLITGFLGDEDVSILADCRGAMLRKPFTKGSLGQTISRLLDNER